MTEQPSAYDIIQDHRLDALDELVTPYYTPPGDVEYSFPVVGQGITADQYRLMSLGQANGIIHGDNGVVNDSPNSTGWRYYLEGHATDAETNQRNTLMLRAGTSAEAIVEGFYHRLTEDMELSFPPVTTPTTYHVCLTFDPRREDEPAGPIHVEVYAGEPPTTHGRVHLLLHTVQREPNQLLSQATRTRYRPYTAGLLSVQNERQLPDPAQYPAGTVVVPSKTGGGVYVRQNGGLVWLDALAHLKPGEWKPMSISSNAMEWSGEAQYRRVPQGIEIFVDITAASAPNAVYAVGFSASSGIQFTRNWYTPSTGSGGSVGVLYASTSTSTRTMLATAPTRFLRVSATIPDLVLTGI